MLVRDTGAVFQSLLSPDRSIHVFSLRVQLPSIFRYIVSINLYLPKGGGFYMKIRHDIILVVVMSVAFSSTAFLLPRLRAAEVDHSIYAELLSKFVTDGVVNYRGFKNAEQRLDDYLKVLEITETKSLSRHEQYAFYINAYNAWTIKLILSGYPGVQSIKDLGSIFKSPWKKKIARIDGSVIALDDIEHGIIIPRFRDPRVHFALNCASKGCPPLISEPYLGRMIDRQLDRSTRAFLNDPERNYLAGDTLYVSKIFKWYKEDFGNYIIQFIIKHSDNSLRNNLLQKESRITVKYHEYDWSLNGR